MSRAKSILDSMEVEPSNEAISNSSMIAKIFSAIDGLEDEEDRESMTDSLMQSDVLTVFDKQDLDFQSLKIAFDMGAQSKGKGGYFQDGNSIMWVSGVSDSDLKKIALKLAKTLDIDLKL